jgi:hypothetical protein
MKLLMTMIRTGNSASKYLTTKGIILPHHNIHKDSSKFNVGKTHTHNDRTCLLFRRNRLSQ